MVHLLLSGYIQENRDVLYIKFIKEIADNEIKEDNRIQDWVKENIAINYPDVSSFILQEINILKRGELL